MSNPSDAMKAFISDLADLMDRHGVGEIEAVDDGADYYPSVDGIEITINGTWDKDGVPVRQFETFKLYKQERPEWLREKAAKP